MAIRRSPHPRVVARVPDSAGKGHQSGWVRVIPGRRGAARPGTGVLFLLFLLV